MPIATTATIAASLLLLVLLLLPTAFSAALVSPPTAVSRLAASREANTASPITDAALVPPPAAPGCVEVPGMGSSRDTGFWHDIPDRSHDTELIHDIPDKSHDWGFIVTVCDPSDPASGTPVLEPSTASFADQAISP